MGIPPPWPDSLASGLRPGVKSIAAGPDSSFFSCGSAKPLFVKESAMSEEPRGYQFRLRDLLALFVVFALVWALCAPGIITTRITSLRISCRNAIRYLPIAVHNYNDAQKSLPPLYFSGFPQEGLAADVKAGDADDPRNPQNILNPANPAVADQYSFLVRLMPYIEEDASYKQISRASNKFTLKRSRVTIPNPAGGTYRNSKVSLEQLPISAFICPSYSGDCSNTGRYSVVDPAKSVYGVTNYIATPATAQQRFCQEAPDSVAEGVIIPGKLSRGISMAGICDGTSKTIMMCESKEGMNPQPVNGQAPPNCNSWSDPRCVWACGFPVEFTTGTAVDKGKASTPPCILTGPKGHYFQGISPPNDNVTALNYGPDATLKNPVFYNTTAEPLRWWGPSSDHTGDVVIVAFADSSVMELVSSMVHPRVYIAMLSRRGGDDPAGDYSDRD
ncbi:MAG: DUF1559 domain-containing protein [Pirellulales bacterium]|nr:DUF1559 domain-containing protein [Pirellulales bacterium]